MISPPCDRSTDASASTMRCDPPRGSGHPTACALASRARPIPAVRGALSAQERVRATPGEEGPRDGRREAAGHRGHGQHCRQAEPTQRQRVANGAQRHRPKQMANDQVPVARHRLHPAPVAARILLRVEGRDRAAHVAVHQRGTPVVEGMADLDARLDPRQPVSLEIELAEDRGRATERMDRTADVVHHARLRELGGAAAAPDGVARLEQPHRPTRPRQRDCGRQSVRAAAHHHRVGRHRPSEPRVTLPA